MIYRGAMIYRLGGYCDRLVVSCFVWSGDLDLQL